MKVTEKILEPEEAETLVAHEKISGKKIVLCLGVFDLLHPGHIKHFQAAKKYGDILVVAVTANRYVNKGPDRPVFHEKLRMESIAAIGCVDYVVLNDHNGGTEIISRIRPDFYVKGIEYQKSEEDITGKITEEERTVEASGGRLVYTDEIVFSSSKLLNNHFHEENEEAHAFTRSFRKNRTVDDIFEKIEQLRDLKVLVVGDAIIDQYVYAEPLGLAGKGTHLVARCLHKETFLGGCFAVANHAATFCPETTLLTAVGESHSGMEIDKKLHPDIRREFTILPGRETLLKRRYIQKDGRNLTKLFETYSSVDPLLDERETTEIESFLKRYADDYDIIIVCDFGNGFLNPVLHKRISQTKSFLALNAQINSGNRGYHVVTKYDRADYISINEPEIRLTAHDMNRSVEELMERLSADMSSKYISVTRGVNGAVFYRAPKCLHHIPALTQKVVDRVGAGDSYFALSSLCLAKGYDPLLAGFLGSAAAAMETQIIGNKKYIEKIPLLKYVTTLLK